jgi:hypothetical protein
VLFAGTDDRGYVLVQAGSADRFEYDPKVFYGPPNEVRERTGQRFPSFRDSQQTVRFRYGPPLALDFGDESRELHLTEEPLDEFLERHTFICSDPTPTPPKRFGRNGPPARGWSRGE